MLAQAASLERNIDPGAAEAPLNRGLWMGQVKMWDPLPQNFPLREEFGRLEILVDVNGGSKEDHIAISVDGCTILHIHEDNVPKLVS